MKLSTWEHIFGIVAGGNSIDGKHYWLTPPDLWASIRAEFGDNIYDPCPYPRPEGYNGLTADWGPVSYVNPPFGSITENGKKIGMTAWVRKAVAEQKRGKTSIMVYPQNAWVALLLNAGAEFRVLGKVLWLATEDGSPAPGSSRPIMMFILRGK